MRSVCDAAGLRQMVREPTRAEYLLDLALTDLDEVKCKVLPTIADHEALLVKLPLPAPRSVSVARRVWNYRDGDWEGLQVELARQDWSWLQQADPSTGAQKLTDMILSISSKFITKSDLRERKTTHPWVGQQVLELVREKKEAEGSNRERECRDRCSAGIMEEYGKYFARERTVLQNMPQGKKGGGRSPGA